MLALALAIGATKGSEPPRAWEDLGLGTPIGELILRGDCRLLIVGDSISNRNSDAQGRTGKSSFYWGLVRRWRPEHWAGIVIPTSDLAGNLQRQTLANPFGNVRVRNLQRGDDNRIFSHGYQRFTSSSTLDILFQGTDTPSGETVIRSVLLEGDAWRSRPGMRGLPGDMIGKGGWDLRRNEWLHAPLDVDLVYLRTPEAIQSIVVESGRLQGGTSQTGSVNLAGDVGVMALPAPSIPAGNGLPTVGLVASDESYDETVFSDHLIWLTTWIRRADRGGLSVNTLAVGGARVRDHLADGSYAVDDRLREYLAATGNPNVILILLGANDGTFIDPWREEVVELIDRLDSLSAANGVEPRFLLVSPYGTRFSISHADALEAAEVLESVSRSGTGRVLEDRISYCGLPVVLGGAIDQRFLDDRIHPNRFGADFLAELVWLQVMRCRADYTGSSDPDAPSFGVPNGVVDGADFFYFLDLFAAWDEDADLTGPEGIPDGLIDSQDYFLYLELFASQCN